MLDILRGSQERRDERALPKLARSKVTNDAHQRKMFAMGQLVVRPHPMLIPTTVKPFFGVALGNSSEAHTPWNTCQCYHCQNVDQSH